MKQTNTVFIVIALESLATLGNSKLAPYPSNWVTKVLEHFKESEPAMALIHYLVHKLPCSLIFVFPFLLAKGYS